MEKATCTLCAQITTEVLFEKTVPVGNQHRSYQLQRCLGCGLVRTEPRPTEEALTALYSREYWGRIQPDDLSWLRHQHRERLAFLERFRRQGRLLDVGCGLGLFLLALNPTDWDRYGLEVMPGPYAEASRLLGREHVFNAALDTIEPGNQEFDVITFWDVLEHLPNPRTALEAASKLLGPGGLLLLSLPNFDGYQARTFREHWYGLRLPGHLYHFTPTTLGRLLEVCGFRLRALTDRFHRENYHHLKHSLLDQLTSRYGRAGRLAYYLLKPSLPLWERISTQLGGGSHLLICAERSRTIGT